MQCWARPDATPDHPIVLQPSARCRRGRRRRAHQAAADTAARRCGALGCWRARRPGAPPPATAACCPPTRRRRAPTPTCAACRRTVALPAGCRTMCWPSMLPRPPSRSCPTPTSETTTNAPRCTSRCCTVRACACAVQHERGMWGGAVARASRALRCAVGAGQIGEMPACRHLLHIHPRCLPGSLPSDSAPSCLHLASIFAAAAAGQLEAARALLDCGASLAPACEGSPPLHVAVCVGALLAHRDFSLAAVDLLLAHGADPYER